MELESDDDEEEASLDPDTGLKENKFNSSLLSKNEFYENEIYQIEQLEDFVVRKPIKYSMFNLVDYQHNIQNILKDLENIILYAIKKYLKIKSIKDLQNYYVILVLPDVFVRSHHKLMINMFLKDIGFKGMYLHLESILACFGTAMTQACVVDIGAEKTNVCCVDEGLVLPNTLIRKYFGGLDVDYFLYRVV